MSHDSMDVMIPPDMVVEDVPSMDSDDAVSAMPEEEEMPSIQRKPPTSVVTTPHRKSGRSSANNSHHHVVSPDRLCAEDEALDARQDSNYLQAGGQQRQIVRDNGLVFDMSQPWQRSLLRELRELDSKNATAVHDAAHRSELILLGHTESRDYAVDMNDDLTMGTDSSSTLPARSQVIHRPWPYHQASSNASCSSSAPLNPGEAPEMMTAAVPSANINVPQRHHHPYQQQPPPQHPPNTTTTVATDHYRHHLLHQKQPPSVTVPSHQYAHKHQRDVPKGGSPVGGNHHNPSISPRSIREERDVAESYIRRSSNPQANRGSNKPQQLQQKQKDEYDKHEMWLELEPSDIDDGTDGNATVQPDPGAACYCLGYNVLDLWMPTPAQPYRPRGRGGRRAIQPAYLGRVAELSNEDDAYAEENHARSSRYPEVMATRASARISSHRADPDGAYNGHP